MSNLEISRVLAVSRELKAAFDAQGSVGGALVLNVFRALDDCSVQSLRALTGCGLDLVESLAKGRLQRMGEGGGK